MTDTPDALVSVERLREGLRQLSRRQRQYGAPNSEQIDKTCALTIGDLDTIADLLTPSTGGEGARSFVAQTMYQSALSDDGRKHDIPWDGTTGSRDRWLAAADAVLAALTPSGVEGETVPSIPAGMKEWQGGEGEVDEYMTVTLARDGTVTSHNAFDADFDEMVRATQTIVDALTKRLSDRKYCPYSHGSVLREGGAASGVEWETVPGDAWVMVPREPTEAMLRAPWVQLADETSLRYAIWSAMLAASPKPTIVEASGMVERGRPFTEWHEDYGSVLWWRLPISEPPYVGTPLDLGRTMKVMVQVGREEHDLPFTNTGGWPFDEEDEPNLWWTPLPQPVFDLASLSASSPSSEQGKP